MARRPIYTSGQVGMVNIPNIDFVQYKAQANMFSDLNSRLNAVTDFAIKAGTQDAIDRASEDMYQNSILRNLDLESMDGMTQAEFNKIVGGDDFTAYGKKAKAVATEIMQTNLAVDAQTLMDNEYSASSLADEDSEQLWKRLSGARDGYVSAYLEATGDYAGAYNLGAGLDKSIRTLTNSREKEIITQRKQDNLYNYENVMTQSDTLIGFDPADPYGSLTNQIAILELVSKQNDMTNSDKIKFRNMLQDQFYTSIADYLVPSVHNIEENPIEAYNTIELAINMNDASKLEQLLGGVPEGAEIYDHTLSTSAVSDIQTLLSDGRFGDEEKTELLQVIYNKIINPIEQQNKMFEELGKQQDRATEKEIREIVKLYAENKTDEANERRETFEQDTGIYLKGVDDYLKAVDQRIGQTTPGLESDLTIAANISGNSASIRALEQLINQNPKGVTAKDIRSKANLALNREKYPDDMMLQIGGDAINNINRNMVIVDTPKNFRKEFSLRFGDNQYKMSMQKMGYDVVADSLDYNIFLQDRPENGAFELAYESALLDYNRKIKENPSLTISQYFDENAGTSYRSILENVRFKPKPEGQLAGDDPNRLEISSGDLKNIWSNLTEQHYQYNRLNYPGQGYKRGDVVFHFGDMFAGIAGDTREKIPEVGGVLYNETVKFNIDNFVFTSKDFEELESAGGDRSAQLEAIRNLKESAENKMTELNDFVNLLDVVNTNEQFQYGNMFQEDYSTRVLSNTGITPNSLKLTLLEWEESYLVRVLSQLDYFERGLQ